jgi:hypothetical protein
MFQYRLRNEGKLLTSAAKLTRQHVYLQPAISNFVFAQYLFNSLQALQEIELHIKLYKFTELEACFLC